MIATLIFIWLPYCYLSIIILCILQLASITCQLKNAMLAGFVSLQGILELLVKSLYIFSVGHVFTLLERIVILVLITLLRYCPWPYFREKLHIIWLTILWHAWAGCNKLCQFVSILLILPVNIQWLFVHHHFILNSLCLWLRVVVAFLLILCLLLLIGKTFNESPSLLVNGSFFLDSRCCIKVGS